MGGVPLVFHNFWKSVDSAVSHPSGCDRVWVFARAQIACLATPLGKPVLMIKLKHFTENSCQRKSLVSTAVAPVAMAKNARESVSVTVTIRSGSSPLGSNR